MRWWFLCLFSLNALGQFSFEPQRIEQGQAVKIFGGIQAQSARLNHVTIPLFPQVDGMQMGLMPVAVLAKPGAYELEWLDAQGTPIHQAKIDIANAHYATQNVVLTKALSNLKSTPDERETVAAFLKEASPLRYWQEPLEPPLPGCITSPFGVMRLHNGKPTGEYHAGLDQRGEFGSPVHTVAGGVVKIVRQFSLRGGTVAVDHGQGLESIYLHMSRFAVEEGHEVKEGDVIGYVGSTGRSTGPHLHWTLYANGDPINPLQWVHLTACPAVVKH